MAPPDAVRCKGTRRRLLLPFSPYISVYLTYTVEQIYILDPYSICRLLFDHYSTTSLPPAGASEDHSLVRQLLENIDDGQAESSTGGDFGQAAPSSLGNVKDFRQGASSSLGGRGARILGTGIGTDGEQPDESPRGTDTEIAR